MTPIAATIAVTALVAAAACDRPRDGTTVEAVDAVSDVMTLGADETLQIRPVEAAMIPNDPSAYIELQSGGSFSGGVIVRLFADGRLVTERLRPGESAGVPQTTMLTSAAFAQAYSTGNEGLASAAPAVERICMDGMRESVTLFDGQSIVSQRVTDCGDPPLTAVMRRVEAAMGIPELDPYGG